MSSIGLYSETTELVNTTLFFLYETVAQSSASTVKIIFQNHKFRAHIAGRSITDDNFKKELEKIIDLIEETSKKHQRLHYKTGMYFQNEKNFCKYLCYLKKVLNDSSKLDLEVNRLFELTDKLITFTNKVPLQKDPAVEKLNDCFSKLKLYSFLNGYSYEAIVKDLRNFTLQAETIYSSVIEKYTPETAPVARTFSRKNNSIRRKRSLKRSVGSNHQKISAVDVQYLYLKILDELKESLIDFETLILIESN